MIVAPLAMSPARQRLQRVGLILLLVVLLAALLLGAALVVGGHLFAALVAAVGGSGARTGLITTGWIAGIVAFGIACWHARATHSSEQIALWIEERDPALRYALVTLADDRYRPAGPDDPLERIAASVDTTGMLRTAALHTVGRHGALLLLLGLVLLLLPARWKDGRAAIQRDDEPRPALESPNRLLDLHASVTPPAYTRRKGFELDDPSTITALAGSEVILSGSHSGDALEGHLGGDSLRAVTAGDGWRMHFRIPDSAGALTLIDRQYRRVIVIDARPDQAPIVRLRLPANDTTLRTVTGSLRLAADLTDDIGLSAAAFEYIVSSGETEGNFTFRSGTIGVRQFTNAPSGRIELAVGYDYFQLKEGDQLSIRAVGTDGNTWRGPGRGFSETRIIRVARSSEYDSLAVTPAPPAIDTAAMSLRMLIIATEKLDRDRSRLSRPAFIAEAQRLARKAETIRDKIKEIMDEQSMGGQFDIDPAFMSIYNDLWEGVRGLSVAEPRAALPPLRSAYAALKKLQDARRYYVRGQTAPPLVNVARVRMTGTDTVDATRRLPRSLVPLPLLGYARRYTEALSLLPDDRESAIQELTLIQGDALRDARPAAEALGRLVEALRDDRPGEPEREAVRRALEGRPVVSDSLPAWGVTW